MIRRIAVGMGLGLLAGSIATQQLPLVKADHVIATPETVSGIYRIGQKAGWTFRLPIGSNEVAFGTQVRPFNVGEPAPDHGAGLSAVDGNRRNGSVGVWPGTDRPGMLMLETKVAGGRTQLFGAAVAPELIRPVTPRPRDFDAFWARKIREMRRLPMNPVVTPGTVDRTGIRYGTLRLDHVNGSHVYGQWARPDREGRFPAVLVLQWAGGPYRLWPDWITGRAAQGFLVLNIQPHDVLPTEPPAYYDALPAELKSYQNIRQKDLERNYFVEMYLRGVRAADYLTQRPDWDGRVLVVTGASMGGQQSLAVAGLHEKVTHLVANVPAGCDLHAALHGRSPGYPFWNVSDPEIARVATYIDAVNFAPRIRAKSLIALGFIDTVCPPGGIYAAFNQIRGEKEVVPMRDAGHNDDPVLRTHRAWYDRSEAWFSALAQGAPVPVR